MRNRNPVSVVLQTKNEELFVERCLSTVDWADEILVLDSGSDDRTVSIAKSMGARVVETDWPGWSAQRKRAEKLASHDWIFALDCDEILSGKLQHAIISVLSGEMCADDGYSVDRRGDFLGILLPNSSSQKNKRTAVRLYNRNRSGFDIRDRVHEGVHVNGKRIALAGHLIHWRGYQMHDYFRIFNEYATLEADVLRERGAVPSTWRIVVMPLLRFAWLYFYKGEWRLGTRGLIHSGLKACSEFFRYTKLWELEHAPEAVLHPPKR